jgi:hypothetical protein
MLSMIRIFSIVILIKPIFLCWAIRTRQENIFLETLAARWKFKANYGIFILLEESALCIFALWSGRSRGLWAGRCQRLSTRRWFRSFAGKWWQLSCWSDWCWDCRLAVSPAWQSWRQCFQFSIARWLPICYKAHLNALKSCSLVAFAFPIN